jgi:hypothetical protein
LSRRVSINLLIFLLCSKSMRILRSCLVVAGMQVVDEAIPCLPVMRFIRERLSDRFRSTYYDRTRSYALRESEILALVELGKFRVISTDDLSRFAYDGVKDRLEQDLQNLKKTGPYLATRNGGPK